MVPSQVFEIVLNVSALGIVSTWGFIVASQIAYRRRVDRGDMEDHGFRMPGAPVTAWATLGFLAAVVVLMGFDYPEGTYTVAATPLIAVLLALGWWGLRRTSPILMPQTAPSVLLTRRLLENRE